MSLTEPMFKRLTEDLEPVLSLRDPREKISAYHDMPFAIFRYSPEVAALFKSAGERIGIK